ncbi:MAG: OmpA family protein [Xanthomonadales bacterium]|nr:OmpA family protein [Xanthomonadales bacterium]
MNRVKALIALGLALALTACAQYVKRDEFDSTIAGLKSADAELGAQLAMMQRQFSELTDDLQVKFENYNARIAQLQGRLRVDMTAHFEYDDATLREEDKDALADFSDVLKEYHPNIIVTVEGFTDPAGSAEYNQWLGMERAKAVRAYLVESGLAADKVRAVSYGEDSNRQIASGAWGDEGAANRRVALVIDYIPG